MFFRVFLLFALVAVAFANPKPDPQVLAYSAPGLVASYPGYSAYSAYPYAYAASPYAALPYAYNGYYVR